MNALDVSQTPEELAEECKQRVSTSAEGSRQYIENEARRFEKEIHGHHLVPVHFGKRETMKTCPVLCSGCGDEAEAQGDWLEEKMPEPPEGWARILRRRTQFYLCDRCWIVRGVS